MCCFAKQHFSIWLFSVVYFSCVGMLVTAENDWKLLFNKMGENVECNLFILNILITTSKWFCGALSRTRILYASMHRKKLSEFKILGEGALGNLYNVSCLRWQHLVDALIQGNFHESWMSPWEVSKGNIYTHASTNRPASKSTIKLKPH